MINYLENTALVLFFVPYSIEKKNNIYCLGGRRDSGYGLLCQLTIWVLILSVSFMPGAFAADSLNSALPAKRTFEIGTVPIPQAWTAEKLTEALKLIKSTGEIVSLSEKLGWDNNSKIESHAWMVNIAKDLGLKIMISLDVLSDDRKKLAGLPLTWRLQNKSLKDASLRNAFKHEAKEIVQRYKPEYILLGIEVNVFAENSNFIQMLNETYDEIKSVSPDSQVTLSLQYDDLKAKGKLKVIENFVKFDFICFTTYPGFVYRSPGSIPLDYYSALNKYIGEKPIAFTEIGWRGYDDSIKEVTQKEFLIAFINLIDGLNTKIILWTTLHDWQGGGDFSTMGLIDIKGREKLIWDEWKKIYNISLLNSKTIAVPTKLRIE